MQHLPPETVEKLSRVTRLLKTQRTLPAQLEAVVDIVKRTVPGCDSAGIVLLVDGEPTSIAVTDRLTVEIDLVQYQSGEGPCLAAMTDGNVVRIDILERDSMFTRFAPGALDRGLQSVLSTPLAANGRTVGALNMYSTRANAFDDEASDVVRPMAEFAGQAIGSSPLYAYTLDMVDGLVENLETRAIIEQATGVLMAGQDESTGDALGRLRDLAMRSGESMRTVAEWLLEERPTGVARDGDVSAPRDDA
ncbi:MAG TPA: GAF and ANTAR domain-containing protein [Acidimicrobiales bacterium]|nr:GAF and ANTAR domain-containing protein [Acidimicrobiales bacterium]